MSFPAEALELIEREPEVVIETRSPAGEVHRAIIWIVVDQGEVFVRSVRGERGRWYRELTASGRGRLEVAGRTLDVEAEPAADAESIDRCSEALSRKYAGDPSTRSMLRPHTLATTLRLRLA